jgi:DNA-directed RNA polymerase subunit D
MAAGKKVEKEEEGYKMEVKLISKDKENNKICFVLKNSNPGFANAIRRAILEEVPTMAIEDIEFRDNSSAFYDEIISHRLGLMPLKTDLKSYSLPSLCSCKKKGCAKCQLKMTLEAKGPCVVYAGDIKSKDPKVKPVYPKMPIVKLLKGQKIEAEMVAVLGKGKTHAKWSPGLVYYSYEPKITVKNDEKLLEKFRDKYPPQIFDKHGKIDESLINNPNLVDAVDGVCDELVKVEYNDNNFVFYLESWGQLEPKEIVQKAAAILKNRYKRFAEEISKAE